MAALPQSNTARLWLDYTAPWTSGVVEHTFMVRYSGADRTAAAAQARVLSWLTAVTAASLISNWRFIRARTALAGEDFSLTQTLVSGLASFVGSNATGITKAQSTAQWTWQGRSASSPRRCSITLFGLVPANESPNGRLLGGSGGTAFVTNSVAALNAASSPLVAIDGTVVTWYNYVNTSRNAYWERRIRLS